MKLLSISYPLTQLIIRCVGCLIGILTSFPAVLGQSTPDFFVRKFDIQDGLSNNSIDALYQDQLGYLWIGTQYGLNQYNGQQFVNYTYHPDPTKGLAANWVRGIAEGVHGEIWIKTYGGGNGTVFAPHSHTFRSIDEEQGYARMAEAVHVLSNQTTWWGSREGTFVENQQGHIIQVDSFNTYQMALLGDELVAAPTIRGLRLYRGDGSLSETWFEGKTVSVARALDQTRLLLVVEDSLILFERSAGKSKVRSLGIQVKMHPFTPPILFVDQQHQVWVAGFNKIWCLSNRLTKRDWYPFDGLLGTEIDPNLFVQSMLQDREGNYWIGTNQGLYQLVSTLPFRAGVPPALDSSLVEVRDIQSRGDHFLLSSSKGLFRWDAAAQRLTQITDYPTPHVLIASNGLGYFYGRNGSSQPPACWQIDLMTGALQLAYAAFPLPREQVCYGMVEDRNGRLWLAFLDYLQSFDPVNQKSFVVPFIDSAGHAFDLRTIDLLIDTMDRLWIASNRGLFRYTGISTWQAQDTPVYQCYRHDPSRPNSLSNSVTQTLFEERDGTIWIGSDGGLNRYLPEEDGFQRWLRNGQWIDDKILAITADHTGALWMSTIAHGLMVFDPVGGELAYYMQQDGLSDNNLLLGAMHVDTRGNIWVGGTHGLNVFPPDSIRQRGQALRYPFVWQSVSYIQPDTILHSYFSKVGNNSENPLVIGPDVQNIMFSFALLNLRDAQQVQYRYRILPIHSQFLPPQETGIIQLPSPPPGEYVIEVEAFSLNDPDQIESQTIYVQVLAPWYRSTLAYIGYIVGILVLLFAFFRLQLQRRMANVERRTSQELMEAKMQWFQQIAHEFRNPLTILFGALDQLKHTRTDDKGQRTHLRQLEEQAQYLAKQTDEILELARIWEHQPTPHAVQGDFIMWLEHICDSFELWAADQDIQLSFSSSHEQVVFAFDRDHWRKITSNLVSNAIKYSEAGGTVALQVQLDESAHIILVEVIDEGVGMSPVFQEKVFEFFAQEHKVPGQGSGIGLALTKSLVEMQGGTIGVRSQPGAGSTFWVQIPVPADYQVVKNRYSLPLEPVSGEGPFATILIAEDHPQIREYIRISLTESYRILEVDNGLDAWIRAKQELPDLIISDILMPGQDGLNLCKQVRQDPRTDHIPFVLLTGKGHSLDRMQGLMAGADEYLVKPFQPEELRLRVKRLLEAQQHIRQKLSLGQLVLSDPPKPSDRFIQQVYSTIESHLTDDTFTVQDLAEALNLSRVHLFRKVKAITSNSPTTLIRQVRLQRAHQLIQTTDYTFAEIAYQVGFKDPAHFSRAYKEWSGLTPSDARK